ncbi:capsid cement protein [Brucella anthropi]|uniref:capsid cement protein n=1 Tax=Brucella anthropi TaxID=529 RepID=UPI0023603C22|nr:capsid cement protein [Brucella anthropi]
MNTPIFTKSFCSLVDVPAYTILKADVNGVSLASANTDPLIGASDSMGAPAGGMADCIQGGWSEVRAGGAFVFGDPLTSDDQGRAIKAEAKAGTVVRIIGHAMADAAENDIVPYLCGLGSIGAAA